MKPKLLVVNDNQVILDVLQMRLEPYFELHVAYNGFEGVAATKGLPPFFFDAIIMDYNMPIMDGAEAIRQIFKNFDNIEDESMKELNELLCSKWLDNNRRRNSAAGIRNDDINNLSKANQPLQRASLSAYNLSDPV